MDYGGYPYGNGGGYPQDMSHFPQAMPAYPQPYPAYPPYDAPSYPVVQPESPVSSKQQKYREFADKVFKAIQEHQDLTNKTRSEEQALMHNNRQDLIALQHEYESICRSIDAVFSSEDVHSMYQKAKKPAYTEKDPNITTPIQQLHWDSLRLMSRVTF